jgi:tetratricopeptide (TPR) repeat protein
MPGPPLQSAPFKPSRDKIRIKLVTRFPLRSIFLGLVLVMSLGSVLADELSDLQGLIAAGKASEALKKADQLLSAKPNDPKLRLQRGIALSMLNRRADAISVFQALIDAHPELPGPYNNLAVLYASQGEYEKARQALELALRTNPSYATASQNLGDVYAHLAGQAYKKALAMDKAGPVLPLKLAVASNVLEASVDPRARNASAAPVATAAASAAAAPVQAAAPASIAVAAASVPKPVAVAAKSAPAQASAPAPVAGKVPATTATATTAGTAATAAAAVPAKPEPVRKPAVDVDVQAVENALRNWARAWSQLDIEGYYAAYAPDFKGSSASRKAWEQERRVRIVGKKKISVALSDLRIKIAGDKASVRLRQDYRSDQLKVTSTKNFEMIRSKNGAWLITLESSS